MNVNTKKKKSSLSIKSWILIWSLGMAGQLCWNIENQWFNTFVYTKIAPEPSIITWMVAISAIVTTFSTFFFGTWSDRLGSRKPFVSFGYILWGVFTIIFGTTMYVPKTISSYLVIATILIVASDAIMSFFGSMGNDSGFNAWISDQLDDNNRGALGASMAMQPVLGTIIGTVIGGIIIDLFGYMIFFIIFGIFVAIIGIIALFTMKDGEKLKPHKDGSFWHQFITAFNFKEFFKKRELVLINITICVFFIAFNVYFVHMGNLFIHNYGFSAGDAGYLQGVALIIAIIFTIPAIKLIDKDKSPLVFFIALVVDIIGLLVLYFFGSNCDSSNILSVKNIPLIIGIILAGIGYVLIVQTGTVWAKKLYPDEARGQFEGIRVIFFVLIPMIIGPAIANPLIEKFGKLTEINYGTVTEPVLLVGNSPTAILFLAAAIVVAFTFIPLYFVTKQHDQRIVLEKTIKRENEIDAK